jgi:hypothetical protein
LALGCKQTGAWAPSRDAVEPPEPGSLAVFMRSYQEQLEVEQYFKVQNLGIRSYWMGLRIPGLAASPW